jgi:hypothetical protein
MNRSYASELFKRGRSAARHAEMKVPGRMEMAAAPTVARIVREQKSDGN